MYAWIFAGLGMVGTVEVREHYSLRSNNDDGMTSMFTGETKYGHRLIWASIDTNENVFTPWKTNLTVMMCYAVDFIHKTKLYASSALLW